MPKSQLSPSRSKRCSDCECLITEDDFNDDICNDCMAKEEPNDYEGDLR